MDQRISHEPGAGAAAGGGPRGGLQAERDGEGQAGLPPVRDGLPEAKGPAAEAGGMDTTDLSTSTDSGIAAIDTTWLAAISDRLEQLEALFETRFIEAERHDKWVTHLTSQLAEYRDDFIFKNVTGRIFRDLIQLHDTICQTLDPELVDRISKEDMVARLRNLQKQLLKTFDRQGLEQISSSGGVQFNEAEQEAIDVRPVVRPEDDRIVLESARCGFRYGALLLRPESVIVGRYESQGEKQDD